MHSHGREKASVRHQADTNLTRSAVTTGEGPRRRAGSNGRLEWDKSDTASKTLLPDSCLCKML